jgi:hypothetical protein
MATTKRIGEGLTFEKVWAALMENREQMKKTDSRIGDLSKRFGESVEYMVAPNLAKKFKELGFVFEKNHQGTKITDREGHTIAEIDAFLENGDKAMAVEKVQADRDAV